MVPARGLSSGHYCCTAVADMVLVSADSGTVHSVNLDIDFGFVYFQVADILVDTDQQGGVSKVHETAAVDQVSMVQAHAVEKLRACIVVLSHVAVGEGYAHQAAALLDIGPHVVVDILVVARQVAGRLERHLRRSRKGPGIDVSLVQLRVGGSCGTVAVPSEVTGLCDAAVAAQRTENH